MARNDIPDHVTYDAKQSTFPRPLVWALAFWGVPSPKRAELLKDAPKQASEDDR
jgi:hypothetical protein